MNCDRIARLYRWIEYAAFGTSLARRRAALLPDVSDARKVLALGDGDGRALVRLLRGTRHAHVTYVDASVRMLELARARILSHPAYRNRVEFLHADARLMPERDGTYDCIVTHFFLDCFDARDLPSLVDRIAHAAAPEARWIVSEFRPANHFARMLIPVMYAFFGKATGLRTRSLVDHHPQLLRNGFRLEKTQQAWGGMLVSELWARSGASPN